MGIFAEIKKRLEEQPEAEQVIEQTAEPVRNVPLRPRRIITPARLPILKQIELRRLIEAAQTPDWRQHQRITRKTQEHVLRRQIIQNYLKRNTK